MTFCLSNQLLQTSSSKLPLWDLVGTEFGQNISREGERVVLTPPLLLEEADKLPP